MERVFEIVNVNGEKVQTTAINDIQASAYIEAGFTEVTDSKKK